MNEQTIRIGTLVNGNPEAGKTAEYIRQILPHGFESFSITFWQTLGRTGLKDMARRVRDVLGDQAVISSVSCFGNPLMDRPIDAETRNGWKKLIDHCHLFDCNLVTGFAGRIIGKPIPDSMKAFAKVFGPLAKRAAD